MNFWDTIGNWFAELGREFKLNFIDENRWMYLVRGLGTTLLITFFALLLGLALGFIIAIIRSTHDKVCTERKGHLLLRFGNVYLQNIPYDHPRHAYYRSAADYLFRYLRQREYRQGFMRGSGVRDKFGSVCRGDNPLWNNVDRQRAERGGAQSWLELPPHNDLYNNAAGA